MSVPKPMPVTSAPPFANPAALGLFAFGLTTFLLSMVNANFVNSGVEPIVFGTASFKTTRTINLVFGFAFITFMLFGIGDAGRHTTMIHWGGYFGLDHRRTCRLRLICRRHERHVRPDRLTRVVRCKSEVPGPGPAATRALAHSFGSNYEA
jgi:succinate-acetate transporter protein